MGIENVIYFVALVGVGIVVGLAYRKWKESKSTPAREPIVLTPVAQPKKKAVATKVAPTKVVKKAAPVAKYAAKKAAPKKRAKAK